MNAFNPPKSTNEANLRKSQNPANPTINVLIVDDSSTCRALLKSLLPESEGFSVIGEAKDGAEAVKLTAELKPDVIVMDLIMPVMSGLSATREIMDQTPTPIVIVSASQSINESTTSMKALASGALSLMNKPEVSFDTEGDTASVIDFTRTVRLMSKVKVVRHRKFDTGSDTVKHTLTRLTAMANPAAANALVSPATHPAIPNNTSQLDRSNLQRRSGEFAPFGESRPSLEVITGNNFSTAITPNRQKNVASYAQGSKQLILPRVRPKVIAIGLSTGGPPALWQILQGLPKDFSIPILVVQHIGKGFVDGMINWMNSGEGPKVKLALHGEVIKPATVYIAPDDRHLGATSQGLIQLSETPPMSGFRPSVTFLFESLSAAFQHELVAMVLTGMGNDGAKGLSRVHHNGGLVVAQNEESSVVFGMPAAAIATGFADLVLPLNAMSAYLRGLADV